LILIIIKTRENERGGSNDYNTDSDQF